MGFAPTGKAPPYHGAHTFQTFNVENLSDCFAPYNCRSICSKLAGLTDSKESRENKLINFFFGMDGARSSSRREIVRA